MRANYFFLLQDKFKTYNKKNCEAIVVKCSDSIEDKEITASIESLEKHTGANLQFAVDELWNNFRKRKNAMQSLKEYPDKKIFIKDAEKMPKTISFPETLKSFLPEELVIKIVDIWKERYSEFDISFGV